MDQNFIKNAQSWGDGGQQWLNSIPDLISKYEKKWNIRVEKPFALSYNYVAPATQKTGSAVVLKIGYPDDEEFLNEIQALQVFNGNKTVRLLKTNLADSVILIEKITPGKPLSTYDDDNLATQIICSVIKELHKPLPNNHSFPSIDDWGKKAFNTFRKNSEGTFPQYLVTKAESLFKKLIHSATTSVLCHGDLHHDNILSSNREEWLAIDPKGVTAEPTYEVAAMIRNPYHKLRSINNLNSLLQQRIAILAHELNHDPQRIHSWCFVQTVISGLWSIEGGTKKPDHAIKVATALDSIEKVF